MTAHCRKCGRQHRAGSPCPWCARDKVKPGQRPLPLNVLGAALLSVLAGCATCRDHPVACSVAVGLAAGAVIISSEHNRPGVARTTLNFNRPICTGGPC